MFLDMSKPKPFRSYSICVKSRIGRNNKAFSLYGKQLTLKQLHTLLELMLVEEREKYIDNEKRYVFTYDFVKKKATTHNLQIFEFAENNSQKVLGTVSFCFSDYAYSAHEIVDKLKSRFEKKEPFVDGKALNYLRSVLAAEDRE